MKLFVSTAALAFAVAFAAPVFAADTAVAPAASVQMSEQDCADARTKCAGDATCEENLVKEGCKVPEAAK